MDRLTALKVFRAIVEEGSFAAAARRLGLSPAAASKNIGELEGKLGLRLFHRTTRRLSLTGAGELYADRIVCVLDDLEEADRSVAELSNEVSGRLRVSAPLTLGLIALSPATPDFLRRYPRIRLDLDLDDRRVDIVREGFDVVIRAGSMLEDSAHIARKIVTFGYAVCASPAYLERCGEPQSPQDLRGHEIVEFSLPEPQRHWTFQLGAENVQVPLSSRYAVSSSLAVRDAVKSGFGIGRIPELYVKDDIEAGSLVKILPRWTVGEFNIFAVYASRRHVAPAINAYLSFLDQVFEPSSDSTRRLRKAWSPPA